MTKLYGDDSPALETWLKRATRHLSAASAAGVRAEIREHYESALADARAAGTSAQQADHTAVASLGDAKLANRQYRKVLLTSDEARLLREVKWEARALCSRKRLRALLLIPAAAMCAVGLLAVRYSHADGLPLALLSVVLSGLGLLFALLLPIYTPSRGRAFRCARWAWQIAVLGVAFGPHLVQQSWLLASCAWFFVWLEWTLFSLRRKLPVAQWPKQLYL